MVTHRGLDTSGTPVDLAGHLRSLPLHRQLGAAGAVAMLVALTMPWISIRAFGVGASASGWSGTWGVIAGIAAIGLLVLEGIRAAGAELTLPVADGQVRAGLAGLSALGAVILFFQAAGARGFGAFLGLIVALFLGYVAFLNLTAAAETPAPPAAPPTQPPPPAPGPPPAG
ncbi:hypothetical protein FTX61_07180 [Nitriliruptoraceae bacterium ZYF776]|nr:hypothetical protein [Profundirhabdus halotolerans]